MPLPLAKLSLSYLLAMLLPTQGTAVIAHTVLPAASRDREEVEREKSPDSPLSICPISFYTSLRPALLHLPPSSPPYSPHLPHYSFILMLPWPYPFSSLFFLPFCSFFPFPHSFLTLFSSLLPPFPLSFSPKYLFLPPFSALSLFSHSHPTSPLHSCPHSPLIPSSFPPTFLFLPHFLPFHYSSLPFSLPFIHWFLPPLSHAPPPIFLSPLSPPFSPLFSHLFSLPFLTNILHPHSLQCSPFFLPTAYLLSPVSQFFPPFFPMSLFRFSPKSSPSLSPKSFPIFFLPFF